MFGRIITFLVVDLIAVLLGFGSIARLSFEFAKITFFGALALLVISLIFGMVRGRAPLAP